MTHLWGSKFVAMIFTFITDTGNYYFVDGGYWILLIVHSTKTMKIGNPPPKKIKPFTVYNKIGQGQIQDLAYQSLSQMFRAKTRLDEFKAVYSTSVLFMNQAILAKLNLTHL